MMKKLFPLALALCVIGLTMTGCEEDVLGGDGPAMKAEVDGNDFEATSVDATGQDNITVTAAAADGSSIVLVIPSTITVGSEVDLITAGVTASYRPSATETLVGASGKITISTLDASTIAGEFEFDATDGTTTAEIRDGEFSADRN